MRYHEIAGGFRVPTSNEEQDVIALVEKEGRVEKDSLDERQQEIARVMVRRGLLNRTRNDETTYFTLSADPNLRRF